MASVLIAESLALEASALANGWTEEQLLNLAGERLGRALGRYFPQAGTAIGYLGKGHNAGDTLVALRILRDQFGWKIAIRNAYPIRDCTPLVQKKWDELGIRLPLDRPPSWRDLQGPLILLDGLLGTGSSGPLREPLRQLAAEMETIRNQAGARVAAVDLPSGMDPDTGRIGVASVIADVTFMIGNAKSGLLNAHAAAATGALAIVPVEPLSSSSPGDCELISPQTLNCGKSPRPFDFHKAMAGRVVILAGSESYTGAAILTATGALRGGGGLVTLCVPESIRPTISAACPPEIIIRGIQSPREILELRFDSLVVGCGMGNLKGSMADDLLAVISNSPVPTVVDADALNLIARTGNLKILTEKHVLTPHPGEFAQLAPDLSELPREEAARRFTDQTSATLLLKGCRTIVTRRGQALWCNATGTPGMATGGQGDLLAGVIGARLVDAASPWEAAALSAWVCGRSAEIAMNAPCTSEESLTPSDVLHFLGAAFRDWKNSGR